MAKGTIKSLIKKGGFGFIKMEDGTVIFFHRTALPDGQFAVLQVGQEVEFETERDKKGLRAVNVKLANLDEQGG